MEKRRIAVAYIAFELISNIELDRGAYPKPVEFCAHCYPQLPQQVAEIFHFPAGFAVVASFFDYSRGCIGLYLESEALPEVALCEELPVIEFVLWQDWRTGKPTVEVKEVYLIQKIEIKSERTRIAFT